MPVIPRLTALHNSRVIKDREYQWLAQDVAEYRREREKKTISLNETQRRIERDRLDAKRKQRDAERKALGLAIVVGDRENDDGLQADERDVARQAIEEKAAKERPDPLLRETAAILADAILLLSNNPPLTALVLPVTKQATVWSR